MSVPRSYITLGTLNVGGDDSQTLENVAHVVYVVRTILITCNLVADGDLIQLVFDGITVWQRTGAAMLGPFNDNLGVHLAMGFGDTLQVIVSGSASSASCVISGEYYGQPY